MCRAIATGGKLWDFTATQGEALYLALEDKYNRLQWRLLQMKAESQDISRLHMATASFGLLKKITALRRWLLLLGKHSKRIKFSHFGVVDKKILTSRQTG